MMEAGVILGVLNAVTLVQEAIKLLCINESTGKDLKNKIQKMEEDLQGMISYVSSIESLTVKNSRLGPRVIKCTVLETLSLAYRVEDILDRKVHFYNGMSVGGRLAFTHKLNSIRFNSNMSKSLKSVEKEVDRFDKCIKGYIFNNIIDKTDDGEVHSRILSTLNRVPLVENSPVGTKEDETVLLHWLQAPELPAIVVVVGMGGLGKTTLAVRLYNNREMISGFRRLVWVLCSDIRTAEQILVSILDELLKCEDEHRDQAPTSQLLPQIETLLERNRSVIVLDDVRVSIPKILDDVIMKTHCKIVITTRDETIVSELSNKGRIFQLRLQSLTPNHGWILFCNKAFGEPNCPRRFEEYAQKIVNKCGGLPSALEAVGAIMSGKLKFGTLRDWEIAGSTGFIENIRSTEVYKILVSGFDELPHQQRACLFYLAGFPEEHVMSRKSMIRLWVAEGFVERRGDGKTVEEVAEEYLQELVSRSMILLVTQNKFERVKSFKLHKVIREIALAIKEKQRFLTVHDQSSGLSDCSSIRRLFIHSFNPENPCTMTDFRTLRSLLIFHDALGEKWFKRFTKTVELLKVLNLSRAQIEKIPEQIFDLFSLRYLSLRKTNIKYKLFPEKVRRLKSLETLDLWDTEVEALPYQVYKLLNLRHLICGPQAVKMKYKSGTFPFGKKTDSKGIWNLTNLQTLKIIESDEQIASKIGVLQQLRTLFISKVSPPEETSLYSWLPRLTYLTGLTMEINQPVYQLHVPVVDPNPYLQKLEIRGKLREITYWTQQLHSLKQLVLSNSELPTKTIFGIAYLKSLVYLSLDNACMDEELQFYELMFTQLKKLYLKHLRVKRIGIFQPSLPSLCELHIHYCKDLRKVDEIQHLSSLKEICLRGLDQKLEKNLRESCRDMARISFISCHP